MTNCAFCFSLQTSKFKCITALIAFLLQCVPLIATFSQFISFRSLLNFNCQRFLRNPRFPILWPCTKDFFPSSQLLLSQKPLDKALTRSVLRIREGTLVVPPPYSLPPSHSFPSQSNNVMSNANTPPRSFYRRHLPAHLVDLNSAEGKSRFRTALNAGNAESFFPLVSQFQTQSHPSMCGLTTLSIILNALGIDPQRVWNHPWRWFAESLLDCCLSMDAVKVSGITMDQLACTAGCQGLLVGTWRGLGIDETRELIRKSVCGRADGSFEFVVASYDRKSLGQTGSGHFSPVAAYDDISDSVLILDVARFKVSYFYSTMSCSKG